MKPVVQLLMFISLCKTIKFNHMDLIGVIYPLILLHYSEFKNEVQNYFSIFNTI